MRRVLSGVSRSVAVLAVLVGGAGRAGAEPLNPGDFPLSGSGAFPTAAGTYLFNTSNLTLTGPGIATPVQGTLSTTGVAVFDFNAITVASDQVFVSQVSQERFPDVTTPPLALLSRGDVTIDGKIDVSAPQPFNILLFSPGGPGGFGSDHGPGAGGFGNGGGGNGSTNPGGGGFGGSGGTGGRIDFVSGSPGPPFGSQVIPFGGGRGGSSYGDLAVSLQGGSGGGTSFSRPGNTSGGGGGGAIEIGAIGGIAVRGSILANGFGGGTDFTSGAGGSGGGIFLHGNPVTLSSSGNLSAQGGGGGFFGGSGGGGGRVLIEVGPSGFFGDVSRINVSGGGSSSLPPPFPSGPYSGDGAPGVIAITAVPAPASLVLLGIGVLGVLGGCTRYAGRRAAA